LSSPPPGNKSNKLLPFEGLRGLAALIVVIWHIRLTLWVDFSIDVKASLTALPGILSRPLRYFLEGLQNGTFAVWIFWVMSAIVLSLRYFTLAKAGATRETDAYLEAATLRRYPRLLVPVLASVLVAYALHALGLMYNRELAGVRGASYQEWLASWYLFPPSLVEALRTATWDTFFDYNVTTSYNGALWTMEKEFFGSLFLFAFLSIWGNRTSRWVMYPLLLTINSLLSLFWLNSFVVGILLCDVHVNGSGSWLKRIGDALPRTLIAYWNRWGVVFLWVALLTLAGVPWKDPYALISLSLAVWAVILAWTSTASARFFSRAVPVFLGKISFSVYLIHMPLLCSYTCWLYLRLVPIYGRQVTMLICAVSTFLLTLVCGYVLYLLADQWSVGISKRVSEWIIGSGKPTVSVPSEAQSK
jgi:peptidoglycan/LPS O-acetylase OafA/YrhL